jgi:hypothetical protein
MTPSVTALGEGTGPFIDLFNRDRGRARFLAIVSPT